MTDRMASKRYEEELKSIERRRWQLWGIAFLLIIGFSITVAVLSYWQSFFPVKLVTELINYNVIRGALIALTLAFCVYVVEREFILKKMSRRLMLEEIHIASLNQRVKQISALYQAGKAVNSVLELSRVLNIILKSAFDLLGGSQGSIMLLNEQISLLEIVNSYGLSDEIVAKTKVKVGDGVAGWVVKNKKPLVLTGRIESQKFRNFVPKKRDIKSAMCVPLLVQDKAIGALSITVVGKGKNFDNYDLNTLQIFAEQAAMAIRNSKLFEETKKSTESLAKLNRELEEKNLALKTSNRELKKVNDELEKFNRLTVGRELQMVKLKEKIAKLQSTLK